MRIVSLLPSATEICHFLGLTDQLVGVSHDCDWPDEISSIPVLSSSVVGDENVTSAEIDRAVKRETHQGRSLYHVDADRMRELDPDLVLTQELCEVCAPSFDDVEEAARLLDGEVRVVSLEPSSLDEILDNIELVGELTDRSDRASELCDEFRERMDQVRDRAPSDPTPKVLSLEWLDPLFLAGHWGPEMVELAGGEPMSTPGAHSEETSWQDISAFSPDRIILMPCGFAPERTKREMTRFERQDSWKELEAVREGRVHIVHGSYYFNRPGPRAFTGLEIMASLVHPKTFSNLDLPDDGVG